MVTGVTPFGPPDYVTDPTQDGVDGYTTFMVAFNPDKMPNGMPSGITDYTGTYSYVVAPDDGKVAATPTPISAPIWSWVNTNVGHQPVRSSVKSLPTSQFRPGAREDPKPSST